MIQKIYDPAMTEELFSSMDDTLILSAHQGFMGEIYGAGEGRIRSAAVVCGDFSFFVGEPDRELAQFVPTGCAKQYTIAVPENEQWCRMLELAHGKRAVRTTRYAIKKEQGIFDTDNLRAIVNGVPEGYCLRQIDETLYHKCLEEGWSQDFVNNFRDYDQFHQYGLGYVMIFDKQIVAGASSYTAHRDGIEVEVVTREDHRRKGLASVCSAALILKCMETGRYPSWDAANIRSVGLAEKLGYHFSHSYPVYEIYT